MAFLVIAGVVAVFSYVLNRYTLLVHAIDATYAAYVGACCREHSLYDVEESYRRLHVLQFWYVFLVCALMRALLSL